MVDEEENVLVNPSTLRLSQSQTVLVVGPKKRAVLKALARPFSPLPGENTHPATLPRVQTHACTGGGGFSPEPGENTRPPHPCACKHMHALPAPLPSLPCEVRTRTRHSRAQSTHSHTLTRASMGLPTYPPLPPRPPIPAPRAAQRASNLIPTCFGALLEAWNAAPPAHRPALGNGLS